MKIKKVLAPLIMTGIVCMYYVIFAVICVGIEISTKGKILGVLIPGIVVCISIGLFIKNYRTIKKEVS